MNFLASPTIVTAMAFSGKLTFNPMTDAISSPDGQLFKFSPPSGQDLPTEGFAAGNTDYYPSPIPEPQPETQIVISKDSQRLEILEPFPSHFGPQNPRGLELPSLKVLMKVRGKCTTDHISAAVGPVLSTVLSKLIDSRCQGPWLKYKGHLTNISENLRMSQNHRTLTT
jgi:homoaconitase